MQKAKAEADADTAESASRPAAGRAAVAVAAAAAAATAAARHKKLNGRIEADWEVSHGDSRVGGIWRAQSLPHNLAATRSNPQTNVSKCASQWRIFQPTGGEHGAEGECGDTHPFGSTWDRKT